MNHHLCALVLAIAACSAQESLGPSTEALDQYDVAGLWRIAAVNDSSFHNPNGGLRSLVAYSTPCVYQHMQGTDSVTIGSADANQLNLGRDDTFALTFGLSTTCWVPGIGRTIQGGSLYEPIGIYTVSGTGRDSLTFETSNATTFGMRLLTAVASGEAGHIMTSSGAKRIIPAWIRVELQRFSLTEDWERFFSVTFRHGTVALP